MRILFALLIGIILAMPAVADWTPPYGPPLVTAAHDREPFNEKRENGDKDVTTPDNECNEQHHLQPDGDSDCDDPKSVPEPGTLGLLVLSLGGLALATRRRK